MERTSRITRRESAPSRVGAWPAPHGWGRPCAQQAAKRGLSRWSLDTLLAAAGARTATGGRPRERRSVLPPDQSPAPVRRLSQPGSNQDPTPDAPRCSCPSSPDCPPRPEIDPTALRGPRYLPGAPARAPRSLLPGTLGGPARPAPWSTGPRAFANSSGSSRP